MSDLRSNFYKILGEMAKQDKDIILMTGDLGFNFYERYAEEHPNQFINVGCIEQSMIGIASGMARAGKKPFVYSGAIFAIMRPYEQIRDDIAYPNLNVRIIGTGASGFLGFTHNLGPLENEEDLLKNLPNIKREYPKNEEELRKALLLDGPIYIRL